MSRIDLSKRAAIECGIYQKLSLKEISRKIGVSPDSISREIRNNCTRCAGEHAFGKDCMFAKECKRKNICGNESCTKKCAQCHLFDCQTNCTRYCNESCSRLKKPPYVCNVCPSRRKCRADRAYYVAAQADAMSKKRYSKARMGTQVKGAELERLDALVSPLLKKGQPLTHICLEHAEEIAVSERTLYRYLDIGVLSTGNMDLRRKLGYKPRKKKREVSEAFLNQKFRAGRTYEDFLKFKEKHPNAMVVEMDTVKGVREQGKRMLTFIFREINLMLIFLMRDGKAETVVEQFDLLTSLLGIECFKRLFPIILTDNGSEFKHTKEMEYTADGEKRTKIFYCDPQASWQKPHLEKNHEYIRYVLPKGKSFNPYTQDDMILLLNHINSTRRLKLDGKAPYDLVDSPDLEHLMLKLGLYRLPADEVNLKPNLLKR